MKSAADEEFMAQGTLIRPDGSGIFAEHTNTAFVTPQQEAKLKAEGKTSILDVKAPQPAPLPWSPWCARWPPTGPEAARSAGPGGHRELRDAGDGVDVEAGRAGRPSGGGEH